MGKLVLFITLLSISQHNITENEVNKESENILEWVYWDSFSENFINTSDVLKAESAALEAKDKAEEVIYAKEWLAEIEKQETENKNYKNI